MSAALCINYHGTYSSYTLLYLSSRPLPSSMSSTSSKPNQRADSRTLGALVDERQKSIHAIEVDHRIFEANVTRQRYLWSHMLLIVPMVCFDPGNIPREAVQVRRQIQGHHWENWSLWREMRRDLSQLHVDVLRRQDVQPSTHLCNALMCYRNNQLRRELKCNRDEIYIFTILSIICQEFPSSTALLEKCGVLSQTVIRWASGRGRTDCRHNSGHRQNPPDGPVPYVGIRQRPLRQQCSRSVLCPRWLSSIESS